MPYYKDDQGKVYFLDSAEHAAVLPQGCVEISEAEADAIRSYVQPVPLQDIAAAKKADVQAEKIRIRDGGIVVGGVLFDTDERAMSAYTRTMLFLFSQQPTAEIPNWKASDGVWVTMTLPLMQQMIPVAIANEAAAFAWQAGKDAEIDAALAANDRQELEAISTTYGGSQ